MNTGTSSLNFLLSCRIFTGSYAPGPLEIPKLCGDIILVGNEHKDKILSHIVEGGIQIGIGPVIRGRYERGASQRSNPTLSSGGVHRCGNGVNITDRSMF